MGRARTEPRSLLLLPPGERLRAQRLGRGSAGMWVAEDLFRLQRGRAPYGHILAHMKKTFGFLVALE